MTPDRVKLGYALSSEEHRPNDLVRYARMAEDNGFSFALISDHFHPWTHGQGQSAFVWSVIGGIAQATEKLQLGTGVTCPMFRTHPAIIAQAAATSAAMMPGRFFLGVGSGERLNEHIFGDPWPPAETRMEMLEEAVELIRTLWAGEETTFYGHYYTVEDARIFTLPDSPPPIIFAAGGKRSGELAGRIGDGLVATAPNRDLVEAFDGAGGKGKPKIGQVKCCWAEDEAAAVRTAREVWPISVLKGDLTQELSMPKHYEQAAARVRDEDIQESVLCGPDPDRHVEEITAYLDAGFDHVYVHQVGPDQEGFFRFYRERVMPGLNIEERAPVVAG
jgi:coenzyme F420-dependent glucose-6-phosphate dehydrogenase